MKHVVKVCTVMLWLVVALFVISCANMTKDSVLIQDLKCEYCTNPIAIDVETPRLSWTLQSKQRGQKQTAFQILVASSEKNLQQDVGDMWDSGQIQSNQSTHVLFNGKPLNSYSSLFWKVRVWDKDGIVTRYSKPAVFSMAPLKSQDWQAHWIGKTGSHKALSKKGYYSSQITLDANGDSIRTHKGSLLLRKEISLTKSVKKAIAFISGLGFYELFLNGEKVGDKVMTPAKTNFLKTVLYDTYDVTQLLKTDKNALGIQLGNGWYNPLKKWWTWRMQWYGDKRALCQLYIEYKDGSTDIIGTDETWKVTNGPILSSCIYDGEIYDARQEKPGWNNPGYDDSNWENAAIVKAPEGKLVSQIMDPIKHIETIKPVSLTNPREGIYIFDMGQNFSGWTKLTVNGSSGQKVVLRYAENLKKDGTLELITNNLAKPIDEYILKGGGREYYQPHFTYHGFRYVELSGYPGTPDMNSIEGHVVHSAVPTVGTFDCGSERINNIHRATLWSQRANLMGFPTDCPQRDERLGWIADAHVTAEEAICNFDMNLFYQKWLRDIKCNQNNHNGDIPYIAPRPFTNEGGTPAWSCGYHLIIWYHYLHYGDKSILKEHYEAMKKYVNFLSTQATNFILPQDRYGDWLSANADGWWKRGEPVSTSTGYYYYATEIVAKSASLLGLEQDAKKYFQLADRIKSAYNNRFLDPATKQYESGSQFCNTFPLFLNIVPDSDKEAVLKNLTDDIILRHKGHLTTGILGTKYIMETLCKEEKEDIAWLLANQTGYPSWDDLLQGRTTLSEFWNQGGSNNHVMFGSVDAWFYKGLAGINVDETAPGFENIVIKPIVPPMLPYVKASINTIKGVVRSDWKVKNNQFYLKTTIPTNTTATVYILAPNKDHVTENNNPAHESEGITFLRMQGTHAVYQVESGQYSFVSKDVKSLIPIPYAATPTIAPEETFIADKDSILISLASATPGAEIRYTLDESQPTKNALLYEKPFPVTKSVVVTAKVYHKEYKPGFSTSATYQFVNSELNGIRYQLYKGAWEDIPEINKLEADESGSSFGFDLDVIGTPKFNFALACQGFINITQKGDYTFYTKSNDGSLLYINDTLVVDNGGGHTVQERSGHIRLKAGKHPIQVLYFQKGGGKDLQVSWEGPGIKKQVIPASVLLQK